MEPVMKHVALALAATFAATLGASSPVLAQQMSIVLPVLSFPDTVPQPEIVPSTKGCAAQATPAPVCQPAE
jgi:hypothetical protein